MAGNNFNARSMGHDVSDQPRLSNGQFTFKGSATAATIPSHKQQNVLEAPMPVAQNVPLEERMYPASVADVVKKHAQGDHSTLQQYSPDPDAAVPYYRMGLGRSNPTHSQDGMAKERLELTCMLNICTLLAARAAILA